jgi:hypothetical protein
MKSAQSNSFANSVSPVLASGSAVLAFFLLDLHPALKLSFDKSVLARLNGMILSEGLPAERNGACRASGPECGSLVEMIINAIADW